MAIIDFSSLIESKEKENEEKIEKETEEIITEKYVLNNSKKEYSFADIVLEKIEQNKKSIQENIQIIKTNTSLNLINNGYKYNDSLNNIIINKEKNIYCFMNEINVECEKINEVYLNESALKFYEILAFYQNKLTQFNLNDILIEIQNKLDELTSSKNFILKIDWNIFNKMIENFQKQFTFDNEKEALKIFQDYLENFNKLLIFNLKQLELVFYKNFLEDLKYMINLENLHKKL